MSRLLHDAGQALYGDRWQQAVGRDLGVSPRTIQRWAAGTNAVPPRIYAELQRLAEERMRCLEALTPRLDEAVITQSK